jgi:hypothetical protein
MAAVDTLQGATSERPAPQAIMPSLVQRRDSISSIASSASRQAGVCDPAWCMPWKGGCVRSVSERSDLRVLCAQV